LGRLTAIELPSLESRREDIPLLARHLVLRAAKKTPEIAERFVRHVRGERDQVAFEASLIVALLRHSYPLNVRELDKILWRAMAATLDDTLRVPPELRLPRQPREDNLDTPSVDQLLSGLSGRRLSEDDVSRDP
jgi:DNA-binding NtrC family response regulator